MHKKTLNSPWPGPSAAHTASCLFGVYHWNRTKAKTSNTRAPRRKATDKHAFGVTKHGHKTTEGNKRGIGTTVAWLT